MTITFAPPPASALSLTRQITFGQDNTHTPTTGDLYFKKGKPNERKAYIEITRTSTSRTGNLVWYYDLANSQGVNVLDNNKERATTGMPNERSGVEKRITLAELSAQYTYVPADEGEDGAEKPKTTNKRPRNMTFLATK